MTRIVLSHDEIVRCEKFAESACLTQQEIEFGSSTTAKRSHDEIRRDTVIGKLGEQAAANFFFQYFGVRVAVDYDIYPMYVGDDNDILLPCGAGDVKGMRSGAEWLLVENHRLELRLRQNKLPYCFIAALVDWDRTSDTPKGGVSMIGYALLTDLCHPHLIGERSYRVCENIQGAHFLPHGSLLPGKSVVLQADNCARRLNDLRSTWAMLLI